MSEWAEQAPVPQHRSPDGEGDSAPSASVGAGPGAQLAARRKAMGWTVEQVAEQLKLARRQVVALEAGDYAALPGSAVVRGFIRAYAKVVKLDAAPLVAMIPIDAPAPNDATSVRLDKPAAFSEVRFPTQGARPFPFGWVLGALALVVALGLAWQFGFLPSRLPLHADAPAASVPAPADAAATASAPAPAGAVLPGDASSATPQLKSDQELKQNQHGAVPLISDPAAAQAAAPATPAPAAAATPAPVAAAAPAPVAPATNNALVLTVRQDSWIEVRRMNGSSLLQRLVRAGATETLDITEPVRLIVGKPSGVDATLRGVALELKPVSGGTTARLDLK
ncbi:MAG: RodZ domain-containing protein [Pseudomonadota bacterium]